MSLRYNLANRHSNSFFRLLVLVVLSTIHFLAGYCLPLLSAGAGTFRTSNLNTDQGLSSSRAYSAIEGDDSYLDLHQARRRPLQRPYREELSAAATAPIQ